MAPYMPKSVSKLFFKYLDMTRWKGIRPQTPWSWKLKTLIDSILYAMHLKVQNTIIKYSSIMNCELSIIVPVYNTAQYLPQCIESILKQSFKNWELILIDDGSTDGSAEICEEWAQRMLESKSSTKLIPDRQIAETKLLKSVREPILALLTAMTGLKNLCMKS